MRMREDRRGGMAEDARVRRRRGGETYAAVRTRA